MTRDDILGMDAGKDLDALVAINVMGWRYLGELLAPPDDDKRMSWAAEFDIMGRPHWLPEYSINMNDAWEIVVKMENNDYWWEAEDVVPNSDPVAYSCTFSKGGKFYTSEWEFSLPLAICKAALLAVEGL